MRVTVEQAEAIKQAARQGRLLDYLVAQDDEALVDALIDAWARRVGAMVRAHYDACK